MEKEKLMTAKMARATTIGPVMRRDEAMAFVGLSNTQFDLYVASGELPAPIKITDGGRATAWLRSELEEWLVSRIAKRDEHAEERKQRATELKQRMTARRSR
jgi:prophage regulatory protein